MVSSGFESRAVHRPGKAPTFIELGHLPDSRKELRLTDSGATSHSEFALIEATDTQHAGSPLGPALDVGGHAPHALRRRSDVDGDLEVSAGRIRNDSRIASAHRTGVRSLMGI